MRSIAVLGVLCLAVVPVFGDAVVYTFDVVNSSAQATIVGEGSTTLTLGGTFGATVYASNGHIGSSDTLVMSSADVTNTTSGKISGILGLLTANVYTGSVGLTDFIEDANYALHIESGGGFEGNVLGQAYGTLVVTGLFRTTVSTSATDEVYVEGTITTSGETSDTITLELDFADSFTVEVTLIGTTVDVILDIHLEGTAHHTPDPALGGLIALGLGGAGTWLRRRRG